MHLTGDIVVDSWNNIGKYVEVQDAMFIFDEQRLLGSGAWVRSFYKIVKQNAWILLTATPADAWVDLAPAMIANGLYLNITDFREQHVIYTRFAKYPKIDRYINTKKLIENRDLILVEMPYEKHTQQEEILVNVGFDEGEQTMLWKHRFLEKENRPLRDAGEMIRYMRISCNSHPSRLEAVEALQEARKRIIVFYNFNFELDALRTLQTRLDIPVAEWNGHVHEDVPQGDEWIYLVQYTAGAEGWNCITTDTVVFYSLPYSYRAFHQAKGRIDRLNTPYTTLRYYILKSNALIDQMIWKTLKRKKSFNVNLFTKKIGGFENHEDEKL